MNSLSFGILCLFMHFKSFYNFTCDLFLASWLFRSILFNFHIFESYQSSLFFLFCFVLFFVFFFFFWSFLGPLPWHTEVPRLGISYSCWPTPEPQPHQIWAVCANCTTAWQHQILNPLIKARDGTHNLMVPNQIRFRCTTMGTPQSSFCS